MTTRRKTITFTMEGTTDRRNTYSTGEGDPSTGVVGGSQLGPTTSSTYEHGRSGVDRQAPERVITPGEARSLYSEEYMETPRTPRTRSGSREPGGQRFPCAGSVRRSNNNNNICDGRIAGTSEVGRRRIGSLVRVSLITGINRIRGEEEETGDSSHPGSLRRSGDTSEDEFGRGRQRGINETRVRDHEGGDHTVQPQGHVRQSAEGSGKLYHGRVEERRPAKERTSGQQRQQRGDEAGGGETVRVGGGEHRR